MSTGMYYHFCHLKIKSGLFFYDLKFKSTYPGSYNLGPKKKGKVLNYKFEELKRRCGIKIE